MYSQNNQILYNWKYWRSLNLVVWPQKYWWNLNLAVVTQVHLSRSIAVSCLRYLNKAMSLQIYKK